MSDERPNCPECSSTELVVTHRQHVTKGDRTIIDGPDGWRCSSCGCEFGEKEFLGVLQAMTPEQQITALPITNFSALPENRAGEPLSGQPTGARLNIRREGSKPAQSNDLCVYDTSADCEDYIPHIRILNRKPGEGG
jgi:hypothetical protein